MSIISCRSEPSRAPAEVLADGPEQPVAPSLVPSSSCTSWIQESEVVGLVRSQIPEPEPSAAGSVYWPLSTTELADDDAGPPAVTGELDELASEGTTHGARAAPSQSVPEPQTGWWASLVSEQSGSGHQLESRSGPDSDAMSPPLHTTAMPRRTVRIQDKQASLESCSVCLYLASIRALSNDKNSRPAIRQAAGKRSSSCQEQAEMGADKSDEDSKQRRAVTRRVHSLAHQTEVEYAIQDEALVKRATVRPQSANLKFSGEQVRPRIALRGMSLDREHRNQPPARRLRAIGRCSSSKSLLGKLIVISSNKVSYAIQGKLAARQVPHQPRPAATLGDCRCAGVAVTTVAVGAHTKAR